MRVQQAKHAFSRISGALRLSADLLSTLQDCSLLFRIKVLKKKTKNATITKRGIFLFSLQFKDTPNLALTSFSFSNQDRTLNVGLLRLHPGTRGIGHDAALMRQAVSPSRGAKPECLSRPVKRTSLYFCFGLSQ